MIDHAQVAAFVLDKVYDIIYTDPTGSRQSPVRGKLVSTDHDGFVVIKSRDGRAILIPKGRVESLTEVHEEEDAGHW